MAITTVSFLRNKAIILHKVKSQSLKVKSLKSEFAQKVFIVYLFHIYIMLQQSYFIPGKNLNVF